MRRRDEKFPDNGFEAWGGYMQAKITKLEEQFNTEVINGGNKLSNIFNGISIYVNGYTIPSADELKALMALHGGIYHTYQRNEDYIIATNLPDTKVKTKSLAKVVKPEWIIESIEAKCLLDYRNYLLYGNSRLQGKLNFKVVQQNKVEQSKSEDLLTNYSQENNSEMKLNKYVLPQDASLNTLIVNEKCNLTKIDSANANTISLKTNENSTKTAADPNFISEFYNNSRLHHISQLGACFKQHINDLRENSNFIFTARDELKQKISDLNNANTLSQIRFDGDKTIMHIDMDCFFVSVGLRNRPHLVGKPVAVTHSKGRQSIPKREGVDRNTEFNLYRKKQANKLGKTESDKNNRLTEISDEVEKFSSMSEIASCSYEARAKGVHNGMFMGSALKLCPNLETIPYDFDGYKEVAYTLYNIIAKYTLDIEAVSCDEMYVDCTELLNSINVSVQDFATILRDEIKSKTGCPCSTGFGGNKLQARLATKKAKPDGQFFLSTEIVEDFMYDIKLEDLPGVGSQTSYKLECLGHKTCGSLQSMPLSALQQHFGNKTGSQLFDQCRGRDSNPLTYNTVRKSVSAEVNYGIRFENNDQCFKFLKELSAEVQSRMQQFKVLGKCVTLKLMIRAEEAPLETAKFMGHGFCNVIIKSSTLNSATNNLDIITREVFSLCKKQNVDPKEMRGVGIQITKLESLTRVDQKKGTLTKFLCKTDTHNFMHENNSASNIKTRKSPEIKPSTPKKSKYPSPRKKSPIIGSMKSLAGKRKGRPPKISKLPASRNLIDKFVVGESIINPPLDSPLCKQNVPIENTKKPVERPGLLGLPWKRVRELLRAWLESGLAPLQCDIDLITVYMCELVVNRNIDKLDILLRFLKRRTIELSHNDWLKAYDHIMENVQNTMLSIYGKMLHTDL